MTETPSYHQSSRKFARANRRAMTKAETKVWWEVRNHKLGVPFRRQMPIGPYTADFAAHAVKLVIEVDGRTHNAEDAQARDQQRQAWLEREGWRVLRFSDEAVIGGLALVIEEIKRACASKDAQAGHTPSVTTSS